MHTMLAKLLVLAVAVSAGAPSIESLGTLQVLKYNDLGPANNGSAAVLVYDRLDEANAQKRCETIGESLYRLQDDNDDDLRYQLDYLVHSQSLQPSEHLWVSRDSSPESPQDSCMAYSYAQQAVVPLSCDSPLRAICTANVPPSTDKNRTAVESSKLAVSMNSPAYSTVTGYRDARSFRFLGIPFANPPVKELRFAPPEPYSGSPELDATTMSDSCIQPESAFGTLGNGQVSEDCLYLNVFTPVLSPSQDSSNHIAGKPVAVYFYGGSFIEGSASLIDYDGGNFASRNDIVVVTVNYRVGALGFMAIGDDTTGNYGLQDQIMALKWVNKHIAAFGGDPSRVSIFGQSAGGQSVVALLSSSAAKGLFSGAISQSAPVDLPWYTRDAYNKYVVPHVAQAVGCNNTGPSSANMVECLRSVPATKFVGNSTEFKQATKKIGTQITTKYYHLAEAANSGEPFMPMVDAASGVVDGQINELLGNNSLPNRVPTMFTTTENELLFRAAGYPSIPNTQTALTSMLNETLGQNLTQALTSANIATLSPSPNSNNNISSNSLDTALMLLGTREWTCAIAHLLHLAQQNAIFPEIYSIQISNGHYQTSSPEATPPVCIPNPALNVSCHTSDVLPIWGTLNAKTTHVVPYVSPRDHLHSQVLNDLFGAFFRTGDPNPQREFLDIRGPAYAASLAVFHPSSGQEGYRVRPYRSYAEKISVLGMPPGEKANPGVSEVCEIFDRFGYTFDYVS